MIKEEPIEDTSLRIFITGASSGIGYQATLKLLRSGHQLILPCRNKLTANQLIKSLENEIPQILDLHKRIDAPVLDLANINSIDIGIRELLLRGDNIDRLILNAGLQYTGSKKPRWSAQNFELTFAVNHLAHHYLAKKIAPLLLKSKSPRVIITSSEVHNPDTPGGKIGKPAGLGKLQGIIVGKSFSMIDGTSDFDADKAYKDSKLCNILLAKQLYNYLNAHDSLIPVIAWAPGLVIPKAKKGFFRYSRKYNEFGQRVFALLVRDVMHITETPEKAGELLMSIATKTEYEVPSFSYFSNRVIGPGRRIFDKCTISDEANDNELAELLWIKTDELIEYVKPQ